MSHLKTIRLTLAKGQEFEVIGKLYGVTIRSQGPKSRSRGKGHGGQVVLVIRCPVETVVRILPTKRLDNQATSMASSTP